MTAIYPIIASYLILTLAIRADPYMTVPIFAIDVGRYVKKRLNEKQLLDPLLLFGPKQLNSCFAPKFS